MPDRTRIVILGDVFWREGRSESSTMGTRVTRWTENKALVSTGNNPKVTGRIGPASANMMLDCVIK
jgi:hypothetical protein